MALLGNLEKLVPKSVFVTGANRGIGLAIVKHLLNLPSPPCHIFATCRDPSKAQDLQALTAGKSSVHIVKLEVTDYNALSDIVAQVQKTVGSEGLNLLINNAGILEADNLETANPELMRRTFEINTIAPLMIAKALLPLLKQASKTPMSASAACVANISSKLGSVGDNTSGNMYAYRASKAALNINTKSLGVNVKNDNILAVVLHPGWVQTGIGGQKAPTTTDDCANGMLRVLAAMDGSHNGTFYDFRGSELPW